MIKTKMSKKRANELKMSKRSQKGAKKEPKRSQNKIPAYYSG
jgi:hypothetical protein